MPCSQGFYPTQIVFHQPMLGQLWVPCRCSLAYKKSLHFVYPLLAHIHCEAQDTQPGILCLVIVLYITSFSLLVFLYLLKDPMGGGPEWEGPELTSTHDWQTKEGIINFD